jgi:hypothetical protein
MNDAAIAELRHERDALQAAAASVPALERDVEALRRELAGIEGSLAWRLTAPLRLARALVRDRRALLLAADRWVKRRLER